MAKKKRRKKKIVTLIWEILSFNMKTPKTKRKTMMRRVIILIRSSKTDLIKTKI